MIYLASAPIGAAIQFGRTLSQIASDDPDLTPRQLAVLMIRGWTHGPHHIRTLAHWIGVTKPVVWRVTENLGTLGLLQKDRCRDDQRDRLVSITDEGRAYLRRYLERATS